MSDRSEQHRDGFHDHLGPEMCSLDPRFVDAYRGLWKAATHEDALAPLTRELVGLAVNAAVTHSYIPAVRRHLSYALDAGATATQIMETLELASVLGIHSIIVGLPAVLEEFQHDLDRPLTEKQTELKEAFIQRRGNWNDRWNSLLLVDEEFLAAYTEFSGVPWDHADGLEPKVREFIYIAIDASTTHLMLPGIHGHTKKAIDKGASLQEVIEVLKITSLIGMQAFMEGAAEYLAATVAET